MSIMVWQAVVQHDRGYGNLISTIRSWSWMYDTYYFSVLRQSPNTNGLCDSIHWLSQFLTKELLELHMEVSQSDLGDTHKSSKVIRSRACAQE